MKIPVLLAILLYSTQLSAFELKGRSEFSKVYALNSAVSGIVSEVRVEPGQSVKHGDVLLKLDATPYRAAVAAANAKVTIREPVRNQMQIELEKAQELYDRDSLALVELQQAENNLQIAEGKLAAAEAALQLTKFELNQSVLRAPDDLLVLKVNTHPHQYVNTGVSDRPLITLANHQQMIAISFLGPDQWDPGLVGKPARVNYLGKNYSGKVTGLGYRRNAETNGSDGFELRVLFLASGQIPANMPVTIDIQE